MIKKGSVFIFVGFLFGVILGGVILFSGAKPVQGPVIGAAVDNFALPGVDVQSISLSQYRGKVVVLNFWATWCAPCKAEMPLLEEVYRTAGDQLVVIGVNAQESGNEVRSFIKQYQITFPIVLDESGELARKFLVNGYPTTFLIDSSGILRNLHIGELKDDVLRSYLAELGVPY